MNNKLRVLRTLGDVVRGSYKQFVAVKTLGSFEVLVLSIRLWCGTKLRYFLDDMTRIIRKRG